MDDEVLAGILMILMILMMMLKRLIMKINGILELIGKKTMTKVKVRKKMMMVMIVAVVDLIHYCLVDY